jgi:hypothetical protein
MATTTKPETKTGTRNTQYDLVSALYHILESSTSYDQYIADARSEDDTELANFFEMAKNQSTEIAEQAKSMLKSRL